MPIKQQKMEEANLKEEEAEVLQRGNQHKMVEANLQDQALPLLRNR
jgi:hypothetical protein